MVYARPICSVRQYGYSDAMRPESLFPLFAPVTSLKGVGPRVAPSLERLAGPLVRDVLFMIPHSIVRRAPAKAATAIEGAVATFTVTIELHEPPTRPPAAWKVRAFDETGFITLAYFKGYGPHLQRQHPPGARRIVSGKVERDRYGTTPLIVHPDYLVSEERGSDVPQIEAIYPAAGGLAPRSVRRFALEALERAPALAEWQDPAWLARQGWPGWRDALVRLHAPELEQDLSPQAHNRRRLAFDELLAHQLALAQRKSCRRAASAPIIVPSALSKQARAALPFRLTAAQSRTLADIQVDLAAGRRMTRLIQGDVGSGKTVVAMLAMLDAAAMGFQSALMAPTEILARQHYQTVVGPLAAQGVRAVLLTGRDKGAARADKLAQIATGRGRVVIGTHAIFQDDVSFQNLALNIIDEQHRFGVSERGRLQAKGLPRISWPCPQRRYPALWN